MTKPMPPFLQSNFALSEMVRELALVRSHNLRFKDGDDLSRLLFFAEGALICMLLEHFVRVIVHNCEPSAPEGMQFFNLLQYAVSRKLIKLPWEDQNDGIQRVKNVRNTLLHGNFVQAAREAGCATVEEYFRKEYAGEIEAMTRVLDHVMQQVDPATGQPR